MVHWADVLKFALLACIVPAQLFLSEYASPEDVGVARSFRDGFGLLRHLENHALKPLRSGWRQQRALADVVERLARRVLGGSATSKARAPEPTSPAVEIVEHDYFSRSTRPRLDRSGLRFRVGQVVTHKKWGYRGIVVGWDRSANAPPAWFAKMGVKDLERSQPWYSVLVHVGDRPGPQTTYVPQAKLVLADSTQVQHPERDQYFTRFNSGTGMWTPNRRLRELYPKD